jgi:hypothetical protein
MDPRQSRLAKRSETKWSSVNRVYNRWYEQRAKQGEGDDKHELA